MTIQVRLFASLSEQWQIEQKTLSPKPEQTVASVWQELTGESLPDNILMAVNMEYAKPDTVVKAGDEVAFFPPVTGG
ncbi:MAG: hypothetical protein AXA67_11450 [Methylothermaceae bacteria B42]|nr:MAG: hypothetical protein AXA67_11450 [Methylothermaceae bacteria B42]HHJ39144.1 molybdopterin converting factor subunit 1 [Methylothermaceae bacterium]